jgi:hypothetical protein
MRLLGAFRGRHREFVHFSHNQRFSFHILGVWRKNIHSDGRAESRIIAA